jgi:hypothetical protein
MSLRTYVEQRALVFRSSGYFVRIGPRRLPLPGWLMPGEMEVVPTRGARRTLQLRADGAAPVARAKSSGRSRSSGIPREHEPGLFALLLGAQFTALPRSCSAFTAPLRDAAWLADVTRGESWTARCCAGFARLPGAQRGASSRVHIEVFDRQRALDAHFGTSAPMRSTLPRDRGRRVERMGPPVDLSCC